MNAASCGARAKRQPVPSRNYKWREWVERHNFRDKAGLRRRIENGRQKHQEAGGDRQRRPLYVAIEHPKRGQQQAQDEAC